MLTKERNFYFIRHGQTQANFDEIMCGGEWDIGLNDTGMSQAHRVREIVENIAHKIETICVSPMLRAQTTAKIINHNIQKPMIAVDGLREWELGTWSGKSYHHVPNILDARSEPPEGETRKRFIDRVEEAMLHSLTHKEDVLVVAHGGVWHAIAMLLNLDDEQIDNCVPYRVEIDRIGKAKYERLL